MAVVKVPGNPDGSGSENPTLPMRQKAEQEQSATAPEVQLHPLASPSQDGLLVKIQPPREPAGASPTQSRAPCDIVLSIDVSGSMNSAARAPTREGEVAEDLGLSVLDLVKHAARTILETLDERDRLGLVTFASASSIRQPLIHMTPSNKAAALQAIEAMRPLDLTNLWGGIRDGLDLFRGPQLGPPMEGRVKALLVLTDGMPNHMCPSRGYIPKLRSMEPLPATIHTFGFGYFLRSGLLKSIAEIGGGSYSFIPDAGMLGTVFIHAVANLQSTFATNVKLRLTYPSYLRLEETTGEAVGKQLPVELEGDVPEPLSQLTIRLNTLQYGQSRDIYLRYGSTDKDSKRDKSKAQHPPPMVTAVLEYQAPGEPVKQAVAHRSILEVTSLDPAEVAYHVSRSAIISFLSSYFPLDPVEEHQHQRDLSAAKQAQILRDFVATLPALKPEFASSHPGCRSLLLDLCGPVPSGADVTKAFLSDPATWAGQIALALTNPSHYLRWGVHYLPSLADAHARQACNSFKDPGPLRYGCDSPLFVACRDALDNAFDALPPPQPSLPRPPPPTVQWGPYGCVPTPAARFSMSRYNDAMAGCFAGSARVALAPGPGQGATATPKTVPIGRLRAGMRVLTPRGPRRVVALLRMPVRRAEMCLVGPSGLLITPWHPVLLPESEPEPERAAAAAAAAAAAPAAWAFPRDVARASVRYTGPVYSVLLERDADADAHAVLADGVWGVTMGHGLTAAGDGGDGKTNAQNTACRDVRAHDFFGDYGRVSRALATLPRKNGGLVLGRGLSRDPATGLVDGFVGDLVGSAKVFSAMGRKAAAIYA